MKWLIFIFALLPGTLKLVAQTPINPPPTTAPDYPIRPVVFTAVTLNDHFWAPRIETNRAITIPYAFEKCEETGRVNNFDRAATVLRGEPLADRRPPGFPFDDSDIYKILEGASYCLNVKPDPKLAEYVNQLIARVGAAQEADGYLYTTRTIDPQHPHKWAGNTRWVNEEKLSHELYNLGHLFEAAAAHYEATGDRSLLNIALRGADLLDQTFGPGKQTVWPGHQIVEMGLVRLYRITGEKRYLDLAKFFLDARGPGGEAYGQADERVVDQHEAVGHAVRAGYMYSGMVDVAALTGDADYIRASDEIWDNVVSSKLYLTGGIGAKHEGEAFGKNFELPNETAYCETCAAVASVYWNHRMFLLHGDSKYIDVMERTLFNGLASGVGLDGKSFFYPNPLASKGDVKRSPWFGCACCPGNITRFMASIGGYIYARRDNAVYINLYAQGAATISLDQTHALKLTQTTQYPWDGAVKITVDPGETALPARLRLRVPGWAQGVAVPSELYRYDNAKSDPIALRVNGQNIPLVLDHGYATIERTWKQGDVVELMLPMPVRRVVADQRVEADRGLIALERGPIVFCVEAQDAAKPVDTLVLADDAAIQTEFRENLLGGVTVLKTSDFTAIPYAVWANRDAGAMAVWLKRGKSE